MSSKIIPYCSVNKATRNVSQIRKNLNLFQVPAYFFLYKNCPTELLAQLAPISESGRKI
jgi:hypothetical protein